MVGRCAHTNTNAAPRVLGRLAGHSGNTVNLRTRKSCIVRAAEAARVTIRGTIIEELEIRRLMAANIIQVTTGADQVGGVTVPGSLRAAITAADATPNSIIEFTELPALTPIVLDSSLPAITAANTTILGTSYPAGRVEIDGNPNLPTDATAAGTGFVALDIQAVGAAISGLSLKFCSEAIVLDTGSSGAVITNNYIGDVTNSGSGTNQIGIVITNGSSGNTIGGTTTGVENVISGNLNNTNAYTGTGILIEDPSDIGTTGNIVEGNIIGLTPTASLPAGNGRGIVLSDVTGNTIEDNQVGASSYAFGATTGTGAGISTNGGGAGIVTVTVPGLDREGVNTISDNFVGANSLGQGFPNQIGVFVDNGTPATISAGDTFSGNTVSNNTGAGFDVLGSQNVISTNTIKLNGGTGVLVASTGERDTISQNSISLNGALAASGGLNLGIDLGGDGVTLNTSTSGNTATGANGLTPFPTLAVTESAGTAAVTIGLTGNPNTTYTVELFALTAAQKSPSNFGQGATYLGAATVTTDSTGHGSAITAFAVTLLSDYITATATNASAYNVTTNPDAGATSEFSADVAAPGTANNTESLTLSIGSSVTLKQGHTKLDKKDASFSDPNGTGPYTVTVDYGDGTGLQAVPYNSSHQLTLIHTYPANFAHTYVATVTVYTYSSADRHQFDVTVTSSGPHNLAITQAKHNAPTNLAPYRGTASFVDADTSTGDIFRVYVDYDDNTKIFRVSTQHSSFAINHQYTHAGVYHLTVTVIDAGGNTTSATETITVGVAKKRT
jgi:parallel beta-helix repeat protein